MEEGWGVGSVVLVCDVGSLVVGALVVDLVGGDGLVNLVVGGCGGVSSGVQLHEPASDPQVMDLIQAGARVLVSAFRDEDWSGAGTVWVGCFDFGG